MLTYPKFLPFQVSKIMSRAFGTNVTIDMIKHLRKMTNAPLMDCKKALMDDEVDGDYERAISWLHKKGIAAASKKDARDASEGVVVLRCNKNNGMLLTINSETDFVGKNELFLNLSNSIADIAFQSKVPTTDDLLSLKLPSGNKIIDEIKDLSFKVGEKIKIDEIKYINTKNANYIGGAIHGQLQPNIGKYGALVCLNIQPMNVKENDENFEKIVHDLCLHIIASFPLYISKEKIPQNYLDTKKSNFMYELSEQNQTDKVKEMAVNNKMQQMYNDICLLNQKHSLVAKTPIVGSYLKKVGKKMNSTIEVIDFQRVQIGKRTHM